MVETENWIYDSKCKSDSYVTMMGVEIEHTD